MNTSSKPRVLVLGAGFGGLELTSLLSETFGDGIDVTLIDKSDAFVFGFSKLDVMFGHRTADAVRLPYSNYAKPGVHLLRQTVTAIDPERRRVTTDGGVHEADFLVVALGADYDFDATPGLADTNEFYTVAGAERLRDVLPTFTKGRALVGVCGAPYKCPPAPSECALMLHDYLVKRGVREACEINFVLPLPSPVPPSPETSRALVAAFVERNIGFIPGRRVASIDNARKVAILDDGVEMQFDLFLGVPRHRVPDVVIASGMAENGWITVNPRTLETNYAGVYAVGDGANTGTPKAGVFAEGAARAVASDLIVKLTNSGTAKQYDGFGTCYIEFGGGRIGKVEVDFFSGPKPTGTYHEASLALRADKEHFGSSRRARWFGM
ncbi:MAG: NAD(P)/FAD-dependent oxidoreductase [Mesorhizobium sp.]|uniref:NAD(P)/FAD-dependent oxidoreductase n=3 Tax=Mesorhizobium TaxID=68287 RepID=UPI000F75CBAA|nr:MULTISPECIES: FAD/NAD(P)-binding oxidoreductase [unclassified Mesorhizobium]RVD71014.1 NAD(P)/FAD-dependent oxidoreductase [Mesorhizobium sp. M4A.F.Ca.ET.029.04.2.1]AZO48112.1 NAD(P)/FAD-dependent oxidoreductase [Mesorhizobium sp. M4B.F.Ca.ET.058.02.1.1]RUX46858.1 NAD(P)/FAD-dependent oxidoreductase [Mesorhizobium sp. M4A.F.Ca.ET.050.02.1.1]RVC45269.1 NAD(P)/FAD-dependent oxidoreductase [Mesorhizobium sp. M4A.F.Ca.ET.090.04.2.1]RVD40294.1 NAD(P)/FAD-dependent oxidoreductase [Mesorhizobium s